MAEYKDRERFIPIRVSETVDLVCGDGFLNKKNQNKFRELAIITENIFHYEFRSTTEELEDLYHPFDPYTEFKALTKYSKKELKDKGKTFLEKIKKLLNKGNFNPIKNEEIEHALKEKSVLAVNVKFSLDDLEKKFLYKRGEMSSTETVSRFSFLRRILKKTVQLEAFEKIVLILKFNKNYQPEKTTIQEKIQADKIYLKIFRNVPKQDLELIFPNCKVRMSLSDKLKILLPLIFGLGVVSIQLLNVWGNISPFILGGLAFAFVGYAIKSYISYKNTILEYAKTLAQGLYFKILGDGYSVIHHLAHAAVEEDTEEALLGYYFLLKNKNLTSSELDDLVENWFEKHGIKLDFEVKDSLQKLERLKLAFQKNNLWNVVSLNKSLAQLDQIWDNYFLYSKSTSKI